MNMDQITWGEFMTLLPREISNEEIDSEWLSAVARIGGKIIVLDDDPTGTQTVHSVPVYTSWDVTALRRAVQDPTRVVYILTNSRALTAEETKRLHRELVRNLKQVAKEEQVDFLIISRSDSTLRGHFPLETLTIYEELRSDFHIDGEIIIPFFEEGGRVTFRDTHYVRENDVLIPAGKTEFAKDRTFGYLSSDLKDWVEEKTRGLYPASKVVSIPLEMVRGKAIDAIAARLISVTGFGKVVVNAVTYTDLKVFTVGLAKAFDCGKRFLFRTAASFVKVIGGISPKPLLCKEDLYPTWRHLAPGLIIAGSYVQKTTRQLERLWELPGIARVEFDVKCARNETLLNAETDRVCMEIEKAFRLDNDVCVYTSRRFERVGEPNAEQDLTFGKRVAEGLVNVVKQLRVRPGFLVAKGGITSSDIAVKALGVKRAMVLGQIKPGVPVWRLGPESSLPGLPYVIFPGNVGSDHTLREVVEVLRSAISV